VVVGGQESSDGQAQRHGRRTALEASRVDEAWRVLRTGVGHGVGSGRGMIQWSKGR
jgi:hypothetical protein